MAEPAPSARTAQTDRSLVREYYTENNFFTSVEGVLKILSIVLCTASAALWLVGGGCAGGAAAAAVLLALQCAAHALWLAALAPLTCFYTDIVVSTALGAALLACGLLSLLACPARRGLHFVHGSLAIAAAGLVISSAVITYVAVLRRWDEARKPCRQPPRPSRFELEV